MRFASLEIFNRNYLRPAVRDLQDLRFRGESAEVYLMAVDIADLHAYHTPGKSLRPDRMVVGVADAQTLERIGQVPPFDLVRHTITNPNMLQVGVDFFHVDLVVVLVSDAEGGELFGPLVDVNLVRIRRPDQKHEEVLPREQWRQVYGLRILIPWVDDDLRGWASVVLAICELGNHGSALVGKP